MIVPETAPNKMIFVIISGTAEARKKLSRSADDPNCEETSERKTIPTILVANINTISIAAAESISFCSRVRILLIEDMVFFTISF